MLPRQPQRSAGCSRHACHGARVTDTAAAQLLTICGHQHSGAATLQPGRFEVFWLTRVKLLIGKHIKCEATSVATETRPGSSFGWFKRKLREIHCFWPDKLRGLPLIFPLIHRFSSCFPGTFHRIQKVIKTSKINQQPFKSALQISSRPLLPCHVLAFSQYLLPERQQEYDMSSKVM